MKVINLKSWPFRNLHQFNRIPIEIYSNLFFDAGYVSDQSGTYKSYNNILVDKLMISAGIGIDFVTYYDKVFRLIIHLMDWERAGYLFIGKQLSVKIQ